MGKRKNKTQYTTWEDLKIIISGYKQILESDVGNRDEDIKDVDASGSISGFSDYDMVDE